MNADQILSHVARHVKLDTAECGYFVSLLRRVEIPRKHFLQESGKVCDTISYVEAGALRAYYTDKNLNEVTMMFAVRDWWITDMPCFVKEAPAMISIEAVEESTVLQLKKSDLDSLFVQVPKFERFFRILMQNSYVREQLRTLNNLSLTAEERYEIFLEKYPQVVQKVTQKNIASYLGITPEFLSAIRNKKRQK